MVASIDIKRPIKQPTLFEKVDIKKATFSDPAFSNNRDMPIHRWVPWIAGFSREFVQSAIAKYAKRPNSIVLDPFAGVGTTLVEAVMTGHQAIGFEINPYAALAAKTKLNAFHIDPRSLSKTRDQFSAFYEKNSASGFKPKSVVPEGFKTRGEFYSPEILRKVLVVQDFIKTIENPDICDLFRIAFAATMISYSNYSYEPSLGQRKSGGKKNFTDYNVGEEILYKLNEMVEDIKVVRSQFGGDIPSSHIWQKSFFSCSEQLRSGTVDLIITSPPYLNNYHYNRNTRPHLYWLGFTQKPDDFKVLEEENFGKFWQTVRGGKQIDLEFNLSDSELANSLKLLRGLNCERGVYGGNGWANYAASYFNDCYRFVKCMKSVLRKRGTALVVIGNSVLQGVTIPTDKYLAQIAESVGLELVEIHIPRKTRVGSSIIQSSVRVGKAKDSHHLYEAVVELRKR
jgi:DNA modification methylase